MKYSSLTETMPIRDVSDLSGRGQAPRPAPARIHAVRVADGQVVHPYDRRPADLPEPDRDWMTVHPGERCKACAQELGVDGQL